MVTADKNCYVDNKLMIPSDIINLIKLDILFGEDALHNFAVFAFKELYFQ